MMKWGTRDIAYCGIIAALYVALTVSLAPLSYGVYQVRISEALTVLPYLYPPAALALFSGCLVANIFGGNGMQDIIFGSLLTLMAGMATAYLSKLDARKLTSVFAPILLLPVLPIYIIIFYWLLPEYRRKLSWGMLLAPLPPVVFNALGVAAYLSGIMGVPYWEAVVLIGAGQLVACYGIGLPFLLILLLAGRSPFNRSSINS
jgi:uncharacterized membrane protein